MAYRVLITADIQWVPDGVGGVALGQGQADNPGYGASYGAGEIGNAQSLRMRVAEQVPGGDSPTQANFNTAFVAAAADLNTRIGTAGAEPGYTSGTPLATIQGWSTGNP